MKRMLSTLGPAVVISVAVPVLALAQPYSPARDIAVPLAGASGTAGTLAPWEIITEVRRAGFGPISRPVQRGRVYVLFALDQDGVGVRLTVDARSGHILWAAEVVGMPYGGPVYYGNRAWSPYGRPPVPPATVPNTGPGRTSFGPIRNNTSMQRSPPLPRTRPADLAGAVAKESGAGTRREPKAEAAGQSHVAPARTAPPAQPTMVPVAPLE
jgi:hypothetical protein